jgi:hypothetical protein
LERYQLGRKIHEKWEIISRQIMILNASKFANSVTIFNIDSKGKQQD